MTSIVLFDDDILYRQCLSLQLSNHYKVVGETSDSCKIMTVVQTSLPEVVLLKFSTNGIVDRISQIKDATTAKVIIYSVPNNPHLISKILRTGAIGILLRTEASFEELVASVTSANINRTYFGKGVSDILSTCFQNAMDINTMSSCFSMLTSREREVIQLISEGGSTRTISGILNVSVKTVESHRQSIFKKLAISSVAELTKYALQEGLTSLDITPN